MPGRSIFTTVNVLVMGVSGAGKSTVGARLAERLALPFIEGDDYHPPANRAKMAAGEPLDDDDRRPWLETLAGLLAEHELRGGSVLASSALKASYRALLAGEITAPLFTVYLDASRELLERRLARRTGHFFPPSLLDSQLATLEVPRDAYHLSLEVPLGEQLERAAAYLAESVASLEAAIVELPEDPLGWTARLPVPPDVAARIAPRDDGSLRVICTVRGIAPWHAALTPDGAGGHYVIFSKERLAALREAGGDPARAWVELVADRSPYGAPMPGELAELLALDAEGSRYFHDLTPGKQRSLIHLVGKLKTEAARMRKAVAVVDYLKQVRGALDFADLYAHLKQGA